MLAENIKITARSVVGLSTSLNHASDITRNPTRNRIFVDYKERQVAARKDLELLNGRTKALLERDLVRCRAEVDVLRSQIELLTASHRAAILAVGEVGGVDAWLRFYEGYRKALGELDSLGAIPSLVEFNRGDLDD